MFVINNIEWDIVFVQPTSPYLMRSDGSVTCGVTDWNEKCVYLSNVLHGDFLERVLCHELTHCVCFAWGISIPIETEEWLCTFMSEHGKEIIYLLDDLMKNIFIKVA